MEGLFFEADSQAKQALFDARFCDIAIALRRVMNSPCFRFGSQNVRLSRYDRAARLHYALGRNRLCIAGMLCQMEPILDRSATESRFALRVYYEDTDAGGVVYYANYLRFIERARTEMVRALGFDQSTHPRDERIAFMVRSVEAEYLRPGCLDDSLTIISTIESLRLAQVMFNQRVVRADEVLFTAKVRCVCVNLHRMKATAVPQVIRDAFNAGCVSRPDVVADPS